MEKGVLSIHPVEQIKSLFEQSDFQSYEMIPLSRPLSADLFEKWLDQGRQAEMDYMEKSRAVRLRPDEHFAPMKSLVVVTQAYFPKPEDQSTHLSSLKMAHYARIKDYHIWFKEKLERVIAELKQSFPEENFRAFTDAVPLLERDLGVQAGLGWIGKNTCLIHPERGSLFFIGEILTSLDCDQNFPPMHDFCGSCTACIEACPTGALDTPRSLDANLCISHWNIESRDIPPESLREKMGTWFFGCDICQTVCPWNIKLFKNESDFENSQGKLQDVTKDLKYILESSNKQLMKDFKDSPLSRAGGRGLKRNALLVIGNGKLKELKPQVEKYLEHEKLSQLAQWTLDQLS